MVHKESPREYQNCITNQILILSGNIKWENLCVPDTLFKVNNTPNHINRGILLGHGQGTCMAYRPKWYKNKNIVKCLCHVGFKKCEILIIDAQMVFKKNDNTPTLVKT